MDDGQYYETTAAGSRWTWLAGGVLLLVVVAAAIMAWRAWPSTPGDSSPEAGFARDMSVHHAQAVEMSMIILDRTDAEDLRLLATDIALTQQAQIGRMGGWLALWDLRPTGSEPPMAWMGHPVDGLMPGMATSAELGALRELPPAEAEIEFLRLMIAHHQGGIHMAEAIVERSDQEDVLRLANSMIAAQQSEIEAMEAMLRQRGADVS